MSKAALSIGTRSDFIVTGESLQAIRDGLEAILNGTTTAPANGHTTQATAPAATKRKPIPAARRREMSIAAKARWAKARKQSAKPKTMGAAG